LESHGHRQVDVSGIAYRADVPDRDAPLGLQGLQIGDTDEILDRGVIRFPAEPNGVAFAVVPAAR
jgi:hypothetical protein